MFLKRINPAMIVDIKEMNFTLLLILFVKFPKSILLCGTLSFTINPKSYQFILCVVNVDPFFHAIVEIVLLLDTP